MVRITNVGKFSLSKQIIHKIAIYRLRLVWIKSPRHLTWRKKHLVKKQQDSMRGWMGIRKQPKDNIYCIFYSLCYCLPTQIFAFFKTVAVFSSLILDIQATILHATIYKKTFTCQERHIDKVKTFQVHVVDL